MILWHIINEAINMPYTHIWSTKLTQFPSYASQYIIGCQGKFGGGKFNVGSSAKAQFSREP